MVKPMLIQSRNVSVVASINSRNNLCRELGLNKIRPCDRFAALHHLLEMTSRITIFTIVGVNSYSDLKTYIGAEMMRIL